MTRRVVVWGTGNVGRPALRAVIAHAELELAGVVVSNPEKKGRDAGALCGEAETGVAAVGSLDEIPDPVDAVVYTASGDFRPGEALDDVEACLRRGANVVTTSIYPLLHRASAPAPIRERFEAACREGGASIFVSGVDPGWAQDVLPLLLSGVCARIEQVRIQEIFNYETYDAPKAVRELVGLGGPMDALPPMLQPSVPTLVWGGMLRTLAEGFDVDDLEIKETVETRPLDRTIEIPSMGAFLEGTLGAFRFEVQGWTRGRPAFVIDHVTRIHDSVAPEWPSVEGKGVHRVVIEGRPRLEATLRADDGSANPAEGGNATAAGRIVNAIPAVCAHPPGIVDATAVPPSGRGQLV